MSGLLFALLAVPLVAWAWLFRDLIRGVDTRPPRPRPRLSRRPEIDVKFARAIAGVGVSFAEFSAAIRQVGLAFAKLSVLVEQAESERRRAMTPPEIR